MHPRNLRLYVNARRRHRRRRPQAAIAANSDGIVLMNYDEHQITSDPGPVASQEWFVANLRRVLKIVPKEKLICALGNYGYDWTLSIPDPKDRQPSQAAWFSIPKISPSPTPGSAPPTPTPTSISTTTPSIPTSSTSTRTRTSATWSGSSMASRCSTRCAPPAQLGLQTFALWRLGEEDSSLWNIWDKPSNPDSLQALGRGPARPRCRHRGRRRHPPRHRPAPARQAHRRSRHRRARPAQEAHHR